MTHTTDDPRRAPVTFKQAFDARYGNRDILLPGDHLRGRTSASVYRNQWTVHYAFNRDARGEYLAVLEDHPLAYASLLRFSADGTVEALAHEPQFQFRGENHADFTERCRDFTRLITGQGLPANWR